MNGYRPILPGLRETDVEHFIGLRGYVSSTPGIGGIVKERPEDFKAWEVLTSGENARELFDSAVFAGGVGGEVLCVMRKKGIDTIRAATAIARSLGIAPSAVSVCGIKDKVSISWQFITFPAQSLSPPRTIKLGDAVEVKPLRYAMRRLSSKALLKNVFEITVRRALPRLDLIEETLSQLRERGLPNLFGHQRFGLTRPITHLVGIYIIQGRLEEAVSAFLADYSLLESRENREARRRLSETWDIGWAAENFPRSLRYEREVARYLASSPGDYAGALRALPLRLRRLMVEAVAARLFNLTLSRLMEEGDLSGVEVGDLLIPLSIGGRPEKRAIQVSGRNLGQAERFVREGRAAVALTVPGYSAPIPRSWKGRVLEEVMEEEGVKPRMFKVRGLPEASTRGSLRPITVPKWSCAAREAGDDGIVLHISLPPGSYATILLRELMKPENLLAFIGKTPKSR